MKHKHLFVLIIAFFTISIFVSCSKDSAYKVNRPSAPDTDELQAYQDFAIILSKAVSNEPELRAFLKREALKQYDKDYDVFYPWTKDLFVDDERSFEAILKEYDEEDCLELIVKEIPLLTILVPDWSWIANECFSINTWDVSGDEIGVAFDNQNGDHPVYCNGKYEGIVPAGCFTDTPMLIIKNNERMISSPDVKSGVRQYDFIDNAFDNSNDTQTKTDYYYNHDLGSGSITYWFAKNHVGTKVGNCYSVFDGFPSGVQRDYIYYNMTQTESSGYLDNHMVESIYKFRIVYNSNASNEYFESGDLYFASHLYEGSNAPSLTNQELEALNWGEGALEFMFKINAGFSSEMIAFVTCTLNQAFKVTRVRERSRYNWLGILKSRLYYIEDRTCLDTKWIDANLHLFTWDIASVPDSYTIQIFEHDNGSSTTTSTSSSWTFMTNYTQQTEVGGNLELVTMKTSYGQSQSSSYTINKSTSVTVVDGDDLLGSIIVQYINPVVLENAMAGVRLKSYNTGKVELLIVPVIEN